MVRTRPSRSPTTRSTACPDRSGRRTGPVDDHPRPAHGAIYGLSGSIWTENGARALRVARALEAGTLSVNSNWSVRIATPYGGFKQSGIGRALGPDALDYYTELKNVYIAT